MVRGDGLIAGPWSVMEVLSVVKSLNARTIWDPRFESGRTVQSYTITDSLTHTLQRGTFPVSGRDLSTITRTQVEGDDVYQIAASVQDGAVPEDPQRVRANLTLAGWALKKVDGGVKATYIVQVDVGGTVPSSLLKLLQSQTPKAIKDIQTYLSSRGPTPHLPLQTSALAPTPNVITTDSHDPATETFTASIQFKEGARYGGSVSYVLPLKSFGRGVDVRCDGTAKVVKVVGSDMEGIVVRCSVEKGSGEADVRIDLEIKPGNSGFTVNGRSMLEEPVVVAVATTKKVEKPKQKVSPVSPTFPQRGSSKAMMDRSPTSPSPPHQQQQQPPPQQSPPEPPAPQKFVPKPYPTQPPHRHSSTLDSAHSRLRQLVSPNTTWAPHSVTPDGITITTYASTPMPIVRGDALIPSPHTIHELISIILSIPARSVWDPRFHGGRVLSVLSSSDAVSYTMQKGQFPVAGRELVTGVRVVVEEDEGWVIATSVEEDDIVGDPKRVRGDLKVAGWWLKRTGEGVEACYVVDVDVKGTIPSSLLKMLQYQTPRAIREVQSYLSANGALPILIRSPAFSPSPNLSPQTITSENSTITVSLSFDRPDLYGGSASIFIPEKMYPSRTIADVEAVLTPAVGGVAAVRAVGDDADGIGNGRVLKISIDGSKVSGKVDSLKVMLVVTSRQAKSSVGDWEITWNGESIPARDPSLPEPIVSKQPQQQQQRQVPAAAQPAVQTPKPPAYIPHRHTESSVRALKLLKALFVDETMWAVETEDQRGVRISTIEVEGNTMPIVRGDAVFGSEWSVEDVLAVVRNIGARKIWDQRFEDGTIKEWLNPNEFVFQAWLRSSKPQNDRDVAGLQVTIYDSSTQTHYIMITSVTDPLVPLDPRRTRSDIAVAGWIIRPSPKTSTPGSRPGVSVTYVVKVDTNDDSNQGAFPKIHAYLIALQVAEVLSYLETYGVPMNLKVLGNTGEGLRVTLMNERFDHSSVCLFVDYFVSSALGIVDAASGTKTLSGFAGMVEVNVDPRMCPGGVDVTFEKGGQGGGCDSSAVEVRVSPDKKVLRIYPKVEEVRARGEIRVRAFVRERDPNLPREFTVEGDAAGVTIDRSIKAGGSGTVKKQIQATTTTKSIKPSGPNSPVSKKTPSPPASVLHQTKATKQAATTPTKSQSQKQDEQPRSVPVAILFALLSLALTLLHPVIGGKQNDPSTPLAPATLVQDASPAQLTAVLAGGTTGSMVMFQLFLYMFAPSALSGLLFIVFSPFQWLILISVGTLAVFVGASMRK
ncbi:hypothetical protein HDU97_003954 [Phlyctochytrium planicorne]|nr:hypothetical protein HDU97_003954 [Phlyctochytrium planicorne]